MNRAYYSDTIFDFLNSDTQFLLGQLSKNTDFSTEITQRDAWLEEINILKNCLTNFRGKIYFEFTIPRMGQRIDVVVLIDSVIFVLEFKTGDNKITSAAIDQVWDYALDLKNFHQTSHNEFVAPVLISKDIKENEVINCFTPKNDKLINPIKCNPKILRDVISYVLNYSKGQIINTDSWENGRYCPTPTIIEAAKALYSGHCVKDISRSDASAINLSETSDTISSIINHSKQNHKKSICFVTGVPGSGKTLVGLNIANTHIDKTNELYSVFLSGNGPLVDILREALTRDKFQSYKQIGKKIKKGEVLSNVKMFIQNVHHFRDDCLIDLVKAPLEHVVLFDEAQRAWDKKQTSDFMKRKRRKANFDQSEPEFLISCMDRHSDWAVIVCLVGGGQEINTGEAGISEWLESLHRSYPDWNIYISPNLKDSEYASDSAIQKLYTRITFNDKLHLSVSMRSFRAENVSLLVKQILDFDVDGAKYSLDKLKDKYPIAITRDLSCAKDWLKQQSRGSERYGIVVSSQAERLRPHAINVKSPMNPIHWFLHNKDDVRSSYYLEDVATEFHVQGLELDWVCVTWDADFRYSQNGWRHWQFRGNKWNKIHKSQRQTYLKNAYRVLLTRARQGMVIVVPQGDNNDPTRSPDFYDSTFDYLSNVGFEII